MKSKTSFYVQHLHIFNLPLVLLLKLFGNVYVFKYRGLCQRFLKSNFIPSINDFEDVDHWRRLKEYTFQTLKSKFSFVEESSLSGKIKNLTYKGDKLFLQAFFKDFEQYIFLVHLAKSDCENPIILGSSFTHYLRIAHPQLLEIHASFDFPFSALDSLYSYLQNIVIFLKQIIKLFYIKKDPFNYGHFKYLFTGISLVEYPTSEATLNFAWPVANDVVRADEALFILDVKPDQKTRAFLAKKKINFVTRRTLMNSLSFYERVSIGFNTFFSLFYFGSFYKKNFLSACHLHNRVWYSIFKRIDPAYFCFSFSSGWPEPNEIAIANSLNIKTINWFYGTSEFGYTNSYSSFTDDNVRFCVREAREFWVWNTVIKDLIVKRSFIPSENHIEVVGPILNGNWNLLNQPPKKKVPFRIAFFDITPMKPRMRLQYGEGPYCNAEMQDKIYRSILKIHETFRDIEIVIKTKRAENYAIYEAQPTLTHLLNANLDRVTFLPANSDPYLAIKDADLVVSTPYTSPSILALSLGQKGIFYDPTRTAKCTFKDAFKNLTVYSEDELISLISNVISGKDDIHSRHNHDFFPRVKPAQITSNLISRLK